MENVETHTSDFSVRNSPEVENDAGFESQRRAVCRIAFEEYLTVWLKIATTKAGRFMSKESLEDLTKCPERFATHYGMPGRSDDLTQKQQQILKANSGTRQLKRHSKTKQTRINEMRKIYQLFRSPDLLTHQGPPHFVSDPNECWESEVDKLVAWTHSLSFEDLDRP